MTHVEAVALCEKILPRHTLPRDTKHWDPIDGWGPPQCNLWSAGDDEWHVWNEQGAFVSDIVRVKNDRVPELIEKVKASILVLALTGGVNG